MNICVFCGSAVGTNPVYAAAAKQLASEFVRYSHTLIYGGGNVGLMGVMADEILLRKGEVIGVIPEFLLNREVGHRGLTRLEIVQSMHERKKRMADLADGFIAMPGGWGTLDELAEILTWKQLGLINQPIALLNTNNFFDPLLAQMTRMADDGFLRSANLEQLVVDASPERLIKAIIPQQGL
jgi:uncharacterized protein (TIGR00730 family)